MITPYSDDAPDTAALREVFSGFPCGVAALAAVVDGEPTVLVASSFTVGVSQEPPLVMFAVQRSSSTWPVLARAQTIGVSVLGEAHAGVTRQLASRNKAARFDSVAHHRAGSGAVFLDDAPVLLECQVEHRYPAGDHEIVVLRVLGLRADFQHAPLVWHRSAFSSLAA